MITATDLAKSGSEHAHQAALFAYCAVARIRGWDGADRWNRGERMVPVDIGKIAVPELEWFHAIPNGGSRGSNKGDALRVGGMMKAEGVRKGVSDTCWPLKRGIWSGLYLEMKKPGTGRVSPEQTAFGEYVKSQGFGFVVCYGWEEAVEVLKWYYDYSGGLTDHEESR